MSADCGALPRAAGSAAPTSGAAALGAAPSQQARLPWTGLLALAAGGFITILTEALPAGLLPQIGAGLGVSEAWAGQLVSVYALGSLLTAIPLTAATRAWPRRRLLLCAIAGFILANTITALSPHYGLTLVARFLAGISAGLLWALVAGYAARMVAPEQAGRAIAVAMVGTPLALSLGIPAGAVIGQMIGWRWTFGLMSVLSVLLLLLARRVLPEFPGQHGDASRGIGGVLRIPGVAIVLATLFAFVLAHNLLYTYIAPFAQHVGLAGQVDRLLLTFGLASLVGIGLVGLRVDRWLRGLTIATVVLFLLATLALAVASQHPWVVYLACIVWGLAFGGSPTLFQAASAKAAGDAVDIAQSMIVTSWNLAIAGGGIIGGLLLGGVGTRALPAMMLVLISVALVIVLATRRHGFR
ncbi:MFS transporter [Luteimonas sp. RIT-PG2_3]